VGGWWIKETVFTVNQRMKLRDGVISSELEQWMEATSEVVSILNG
jgi:hypothetical protein